MCIYIYIYMFLFCLQAMACLQPLRTGPVCEPLTESGGDRTASETCASLNALGAKGDQRTEVVRFQRRRCNLQLSRMLCSALRIDSRKNMQALTSTRRQAAEVSKEFWLLRRYLNQHHVPSAPGCDLHTHAHAQEGL